MTLSNKTTGLLAAGLLFAAARADEVTLATGDERLSGRVRGIDAAGVVELESPLSPTPLRLHAAAVRKVEFSEVDGQPAAGLPAARLELANGDVLSVDVESLDGGSLTVLSAAAGRLTIPRAALSSLQLGAGGPRQIYAGPNGLEEWTTAGGQGQDITFERGRLVVTGPGSAALKIDDLPRDFILRFTLAWQARQMPNLQVFFADPMAARGQASDRYYLQFNGAGLELKREAAKGPRYTSIIQLNRTPNQFPDRELKVEIRVNRGASRLELFLNGEPEGRFDDPVPGAPKGGGLVFVCNAAAGHTQDLRAIEVLELNDSATRHRSEERGDPKQDSLISREEDRWGGRLVEIRPEQGGALFKFKSDFKEELLEIPAGEVSTIFFAKPDPTTTAAAPLPFVLRLSGGGRLQVESCRFDADAAEVRHPLLGSLRLARREVQTLERLTPQPPNAKKP